MSARNELLRYLTILDQHGAWAFTFPPPALSPGEKAGPEVDARPSNQIVERRFQGLGLDMAPENPDVYKNEVCRRARQITIAGQTIYCEWHGKLEPHRNRVHVYPPIRELGGKVVIGIFHEHLPLPG